MSENQQKSTVAVDVQFVYSLLSAAVSMRASDIHITQGKPVYLRIDGRLVVLPDAGIWEKYHIKAFLTLLKIPDAFAQNNSVNTSFTLNGTRFRFHGYRSLTGVSIALRTIPLEIPNFDDLHLPESIKTLLRARKGLVLVTGPTGSGKSTTLASFVNEVNKDSNETKNIVTVENPVEFLYEEINARINQREVGRNVASFSDAIIDAVREDPDIVVLGELPDHDSIQNALTLAETGHLVLATLHTNGAAETFDRILDAFPGTKHDQVRAQLANSLQGIINQQLVPLKGGGRAPVIEYLTLEDPSIRQKLRHASDVQSIGAILNESKGGVISRKRSVALLVHKNLISLDEAAEYASVSKEDIQRIVNSLRNS